MSRKEKCEVKGLAHLLGSQNLGCVSQPALAFPHCIMGEIRAVRSSLHLNSFSIMLLTTFHALSASSLHVHASIFTPMSQFTAKYGSCSLSAGANMKNGASVKV